MNFPRRLFAPIAVTVASCTAMTGEPALAKMSMPLRVVDASTGIAAFLPRATLRTVSRSERSSA